MNQMGYPRSAGYFSHMVYFIGGYLSGGRGGGLHVLVDTCPGGTCPGVHVCWGTCLSGYMSGGYISRGVGWGRVGWGGGFLLPYMFLIDTILG